MTERDEENHGYRKRVKPRTYNRQTPVVAEPSRSVVMTGEQYREHIRRLLKDREGKR
ncbi:hypothetical protein ACFQ3P_13790 [Paraburkholderia sabiae]|uniref:Uncharacterized protein n=1 Tax=Paraburkholderia sabiae TaxID=273251 RepID=A0ABU9QD48_9BURK|nr:hypothetical protein [Paraburkholderia sabiae]WJZ76171.1 hypothetical protein QEN71_10330 [Paraburkholderia sabiae]CAD6525961.1 hypothetical protein LMG24235_01903 [Paraburkholderia sabiae]